jgi:hypothetical protein
MTLGTRAGTGPGEAIRTGMVLKAFPIGTLMMHLNRLALDQAMSRGERAWFLGQYFLTMTMLGGLGLQMWEVSRGKDPRPMVGEGALEFWSDSFSRSGSLSILGDMIMALHTRGELGAYQLLGGPVYGSAFKLGRLAFKSLPQTLGDEAPLPLTTATREAVDTLGQFVPGRSLHFVALAYQRLLLDQLGAMIDPRVGTRFEAQRRQARTLDTQFWWEPGDTAPERAPALENVLGR